MMASAPACGPPSGAVAGAEAVICGDDAYLAGRSEEMLQVLRRERQRP
jgi:hypothetical protein